MKTMIGNEDMIEQTIINNNSNKISAISLNEEIEINKN
jgi:hypothetical protein